MAQIAFPLDLAAAKLNEVSTVQDGHRILNPDVPKIKTLQMSGDRPTVREIAYILNHPEQTTRVDSGRFFLDTLCEIPRCISCYQLRTRSVKTLDQFSEVDFTFAEAYLKRNCEDKKRENGCQVWKKKSQTTMFGKANRQVTNFAYEVYHRTILKGSRIITCTLGTPMCIEKSHMQLETLKEHFAKLAQDPTKPPRKRGAEINTAKLTEDEARYVFLNPEKKTPRELADKYGVSAASISSIQNRKSWAYLTQDLETPPERAGKEKKQRRKIVPAMTTDTLLQLKKRIQKIKEKTKSSPASNSKCWTGSTPRIRVNFKGIRRDLARAVLAVAHNDESYLDVKPFRKCKTKNCLEVEHLTAKLDIAPVTPVPLPIEPALETSVTEAKVAIVTSNKIHVAPIETWALTLTLPIEKTIMIWKEQLTEQLERMSDVKGDHRIAKKNSQGESLVISIDARSFSLRKISYILENKITRMWDTDKFILKSCCPDDDCLTCLGLQTRQLQKVEDFSEFDKKMAQKYLHQKSEIDLNGCQTWMGANTTSGQGLFTFAGIQKIVSRIAWELHHNQTLEESLRVRHTCRGNRKCINPAHLVVKTPKGSSEFRKVQGTLRYGEGNHLTKIPTRELPYIRSSKKRPLDIARELGVCKAQILRIQRGQSRRHEGLERKDGEPVDIAFVSWFIHDGEKEVVNPVYIKYYQDMIRNKCTEIDSVPDDCYAEEHNIKPPHWIVDTKSVSTYIPNNYMGKTPYGNRVSWTVFKNDGDLPPKDLEVRHLCAIPRCWNPDHLAIGTAEDNTWDRMIHARERARKRQRTAVSE